MTPVSKPMNIKFPFIIAHRGASAYAPENTIAAMQMAKAKGATWIECDVTVSSDGFLVLLHDAMLDRTSNGSGLVFEKTYLELSKLDAGRWFHSDFIGERLPLFEDVLRELVHFDLNINVEIVAPSHRVNEVAEKVLKTIHQVWPSSLSPSLSVPLISSFNIDALRAVRALHATIPIGLLLRKWITQWHEIVDELQCISVHLHYDFVNQKRIDEIHEHGQQVLVYTINSKREAKRCLDMGVDAIFSDHPDLLG